MSDKQGQDGELYVLFDPEKRVVLNQQARDYHTVNAWSAEDALTRGLFNPQTERVVPKGAEVWTREQLALLVLQCRRDAGENFANPNHKLADLDDLIAQARGKGE